jgi:hypothetical protein
MPELDQPFGRRRWDPLTEAETSTATEATSSADGDDAPAKPAQSDVAD